MPNTVLSSHTAEQQARAHLQIGQQAAQGVHAARAVHAVHHLRSAAGVAGWLVGWLVVWGQPRQERGQPGPAAFEQLTSKQTAELKACPNANAAALMHRATPGRTWSQSVRVARPASRPTKASASELRRQVWPGRMK